MNESEFRKRLNDAIGEPPSMVPPVVSGGPASTARTQPRLLAIVALALAVLLVLVLVATRIAFHPTANVGPAGKPSPPPAPQAAADSFPCALPVHVVVEAGNPNQPGVVTNSAGFINIPGGAFQVDSSARVSDLPGGGEPGYYSAQFKRWLPSGAQAISPDGTSYAYVTLLPAGSTYSTASASELHMYNLASKSDRRLWSYQGWIDRMQWTPTGILVDAHPLHGITSLWWLIDPTTGTATQQPGGQDPMMLPPSAIPSGYHGYSSSGGNDGRMLVRFGSRDAGTKFTIAIDDNGTITTIYSGTAGEAKDFDPDGISFDAHGAWMNNFDGKYIWLWSQSAGLRSFTINGGVPAPAGYQFVNISYFPAGACVPGTFIGADAKPLPAATSPSPTPPPPVIDWSTLEAKPLHLDQLSSGAPCPVSTNVDLNVKARSGKWPNYGFGPGPAYVSGQYMWYSAGSQGVLILVDPKYKGPVLIRVRRIDGSGSAQMTGGELQALSDGYGLPQTSSPPYWGTWSGTITPSTPGCYGIQLDGTSFSAVVVIEVKKGPPPPG